MNTNRKILTGGFLLLISGLITAITSFTPSVILQYIFSGTALVAGILGVMIGRETSENFVQSTYYKWTGVVLIMLSIALGIWATSIMGFIYVMGFFLLVLGVAEFVFALQILNYETPIPWELLGLKLTMAAVTAVGAAWIMTVAATHIHSAIFFLGLLVILVGLGFIRISWLSKQTRVSSVQ